MKSPVLKTFDEFQEWVKTVPYCLHPVIPHEKRPWTWCIAVVIPGDAGCADIVFVYYHEFQTARYD